MGPDEERIKTAKGLIEETIQRNKTPDKLITSTAAEQLDNNNEPNYKTTAAVTSEGSGGTYSYTVEVGEESIKILGGNADLVRVAKRVLDQHFAANQTNSDPGNSQGDNNIPNGANGTSDAGPIIRYERRQLLAFSNSPFCHQEPSNWSENWDALKHENPGLARNVKKTSGSSGNSSSSATPSGGEEQQQQVGNEVGEGVIEGGGGEGFEKEYYKPTPDLFLRKTPSFPEGFVLPYPRTYSKPEQVTNNFQKQQQQQTAGGGSHLDRLFTGAGAAAAGSSEGGGQHHHSKQPGQANTLQSLLSNAKVWDEATQKWVPESRLTRN